MDQPWLTISYKCRLTSVDRHLLVAKYVLYGNIGSYTAQTARARAEIN